MLQKKADTYTNDIEMMAFVLNLDDFWGVHFIFLNKSHNFLFIFYLLKI